jgi:hypothetical protein
MDHLETDHKYNLFFGLQDGELRHISEVENGLKCKCFCPACEKKLVARNGGRKRIHHFAHYESAECKYGVQTSIHIAAKQILEKIGKIKVPSVFVYINTEIEKSVYEFISHGDFHKISDELYIPIDSVVLEKKLHKYIPDVVITSKNKRLIIEIAVTHFVGRQKLEKIKASKISAIEIDLSNIDNDFNLADLELLIIENLENKIWLHNQFGQEQTLKKRAEILKQINAKNLKEWQDREKREIWYKQYYKPVIQRQVSDDYVVLQVENCPLEKREYNGQFYASVKRDCVECTHSRWLRNNDQFLICLYDYNNDKPKRKNSK